MRGDLPPLPLFRQHKHTYRLDNLKGSSEPEIYELQYKKEVKIIEIKFLLPMYEIQ